MKLFEYLSVLSEGLGWGMVAVNCYILTYYTVVVSWSIHYLYSTFASMSSGDFLEFLQNIVAERWFTVHHVLG
jgi:SNF family Na+-dependent transporter